MFWWILLYSSPNHSTQVRVKFLFSLFKLSKQQKSNLTQMFARVNWTMTDILLNFFDPKYYSLFAHNEKHMVHKRKKER